jgi:PleD family two-component response regulator
MTTPLPTNRQAAVRKRRPKPERRVFICDDDLEFADELSSALTMVGFAAETLKGGKTAAAVIADFRPHTILLDIYMPPPDGFEVLDIVGRDTRRSEISLILASGSGPLLLEVAARFCVARSIRLAGAFEKPVRLADIIRLCDMPAPAT